MSVNAIGSISGTAGVTDAGGRLQRAQRKHAADLAAKAAAARELTAQRDAVSRAQDVARKSQATEVAEQLRKQQPRPVAQTLQQQSKPITASSSALGGSFDVTV